MKSRDGSLRTIACIISFSLALTGCASSDVSRDASANVDMGVQNAKNLASGMGSGNVADSYQNANQATKGAILAGSAGAITGTMASGVGVIAGAAVGAIMGASYGSYIDANASLKDRLINRGANIIVLGDQVMIVIPSARLFNPYTSQLKSHAYSTLDMLASYINQYQKIMVKIGAYTADQGAKEASIALSTQQADHVAKYLMQAGVDARVLYANGYGATNIVSNNKLGWGNGDNYRIEVTLEKLHAG